MAQKTKVKKLGVVRKAGYIYFVGGSPLTVGRSKRGQKGTKSVVQKTTVKREKGFLYFLDSDGDISKSKMKRRGQ